MCTLGKVSATDGNHPSNGRNTEVKIEQNVQLRVCQEVRSEKSPYLRSRLEDKLRDKGHKIIIEHVAITKSRFDESDGSKCPEP